MKTRTMFLATLLLCLLPVAASAQTFTASLSGTSDAAGFAVISVSGTTMAYTIANSGLPAISSAAIRNAGGDAVVTFSAVPVGGLIAGSQTVAQDVVNAIAGNPAAFSIEVRTAASAIRGQLTGVPAPDGARVLYLPVVGKVAGAAGTNFVTDARIVNRGTAVANVTLEYYQQSASGRTSATATRAFTVAPGEQTILDDVIGSLSTSGLGGLRVTSDQNVSVSARVLNDLRGAGLGTTGFAVNASELEDAGTSGTLPFLSNASVADISSGTGFRTNIGYFNPSATPLTATFTARRSSDGAVLGTNTLSVPGLSFVQQGAFALMNTVPAADQIQGNFYVTWTASAPLFVYGSVVDNKTGDSVLID